MSEQQANGFTSRELLRMLVDKTEAIGNKVSVIETKIDSGKEKMDDHEKDIKSLNGWMNGIKAITALMGSALGIHFFKNGGI